MALFTRLFLLLAVVVLANCSLHHRLIKGIQRLSGQSSSQTVGDEAVQNDGVQKVLGSLLELLPEDNNDDNIETMPTVVTGSDSVASRPKKQLSPELRSSLVRLLPLIKKNFATDKHLHELEGLASNLPTLVRRILPTLKSHLPKLANSQEDMTEAALLQTFRSIENFVELADM